MVTPQIIQNRYQVLDELGQGGMGIVYKVYDRLAQRHIALKKLRFSADQLSFVSKQDSDDLDKLRLSLTREFSILATLRHPHIISVLDYGFDENLQPYFTMPLLEDAVPLNQIGHDVSLTERLTLLIQMLEALVYLHRRGFIHRDLKPSNVLVTAGTVQVLDFGLVIETEHTATTAGTLAYMAPEVLLGEAPTLAADLFAVGVMAYELLAGVHPFQVSSDIGLIEAILKSNPDLTRLDHHVPPTTALIDKQTTVALQDTLTIILEAPSATNNPAPEAQVARRDVTALSPLATVIGRLLAKDPAYRYPDAYTVIVALHTAGERTAPPEPLEIRESFLQAARFVGRRRELDQLEAALHHAQDGQGAMWLVGGESGVGKTRLLDELRIRALVGGTLVLRSTAIEGATNHLQFWRDILRNLLLVIEISPLEASILRYLVPDIETLTGFPVSAPPEVDASVAEQRLNNIVVDCLTRIAQPTLLLLEDLQWAGAAIAPLKRLISILSDLPLLVIGSYRSDEHPALPAELPGISSLHLARMTLEEIQELSNSMLGQQGKSSEVLDLLHRETEGNVFFLVETVRALAEEAGSLMRVGQTTLPAHVFAGGVRQIIRRRLARIPASIRPLVEIAAVIGRELDLKLLSYITSTPQLNDQVYAAAAVAVLEVRDERWQFAHDKLRETLLQDLSVETRAAYHRKVAEGITVIYPDDPRWVVPSIDHWFASGDIRRMLDVFFASAAQLIVWGDIANVDRLIERALPLAPNDHDRLNLLIWRSTLYDRQGAFQISRETLVDELPLIRQLGDKRLLLRALRVVGDTSRFLNGHPDPYYEEAQALAEELPDYYMLSNLLISHGNLAVHRGDFNLAETYFQRSLDAHRRGSKSNGQSVAMLGLGSVNLHRGDFPTARTYYEQARALAEAEGDRSQQAHASHNLGILNAQMGDFAEAHSNYEKALALHESIQNLSGIANTLNGLGIVAYHQQQYNQALHYYSRSQVIAKELGDMRLFAHSANNLGELARSQGNLELARRYYEAALGVLRELGDQWGTALALDNLGHVSAADDPTAAWELYSQAIALANRHNVAVIVMDALAGMAALLLQNGDAVTAAEWLGLVLNHPSTVEETRQEIAPMMTRLKAVLAEDDLNRALERGQHSLNLSHLLGDLPPTLEQR